jgi:hypothetical protein
MIEKELVQSLLFYATMLDNKNSCEEFHKELERMSLTWDYYYRTLDKARNYLDLKEK